MIRTLFSMVLLACSFAVAVAAVDDATMIQPADLFSDFPAVHFGMTYDAVKSAVEKTGAHPGGNKNEMAWDGKFGEYQGRATVHFKEERAVQISVVQYAMAKRAEVFEKWAKQISDKHGVAEDTDTSDVKSKLWRLKTGIAIELRLVKDDDSPVVDVRWVKL
jgi:hypothetical protein